MIDPAAPTFWPQLMQVLLEGTWETVYMTAIAMAITFVVGLPLGIILVGTEQGRFLEAPFGSRALGRVVNDDPEMREYLQRAVGYMATGFTHEQAFWIFQGKGRDGKSTMVVDPDSEFLKYFGGGKR